jgi:hypothetical protein
MDTWGDRAEYIRTGLKLDLWEKNLDLYVTKTQLPISIMCTFNILSVTSFTLFLQKILDWRKKYQEKLNPGGYGRRIRFDTPYLKEPLQYDMNLLPKGKFMPHMYNHLKYIKENIDDQSKDKFTNLEYEKFRRVVDYMETTQYSTDKIKEGRKDFYNWFTEYDRRRSVDFVSTFPTMVDFYNRCKDE